jgi:hypothetical protein
MLAAEGESDKASAVAAREPNEASKLTNLSCLMRKCSRRWVGMEKEKSSGKADDEFNITADSLMFLV